jgi:hypothetical protein
MIKSAFTLRPRDLKTIIENSQQACGHKLFLLVMVPYPIMYLNRELCVNMNMF